MGQSVMPPLVPSDVFGLFTKLEAAGVTREDLQALVEDETLRERFKNLVQPSLPGRHRADVT